MMMMRIDHGEFKGSNFDDVQQPEIAIWPPKPEIYISETMTDSVEISTTNAGISTMSS